MSRGLGDVYKRQAKEQAQELLKESNRNIENTIREIRECQAEKEETKRLREELKAFKEDVNEIDTKSADDLIEKKMRQIMERKERHEKRKKEKKENAANPATSTSQLLSGGALVSSAPTNPTTSPLQTFKAGDTVRMRGLTTVGRVESVEGKEATVVFGDVRTKVKTSRLEHTTKTPESTLPPTFGISRETRQTIDSHKLNFHQDLDVRGMRGDEALNAVQHFIDDAILVGMSRVRILHGKGNGILRQLIRQYLQSVPNVTQCKDEHVQFGGAGITVVDF